MRVADLPKEIQEIALERHKEQRDRIYFTGNLSGVFTWSDTKEGHAFWSKIDVGNFDDFYKKYPKSEDKGFKVGDVVEVINTKHWSSIKTGMTFTITQVDVDTFNGRIKSAGNTIYHFENNKHGVNFTLDMLKLIETKQYYTSIPKDVKVGDTFEIIGGRGFDGNDKYNYDWPIGSIITLDYNDGTFCPSFRNKDGDTLYLDWGWLKPVESKSSTKKSDLLPVGTIVRISAKGKREYCDTKMNPFKLTGKIIKHNDGGYPYQVLWENTKENAYTRDDVEEVVNDKSNNYGFNVGDEVWYTDDAISILKKSQEHNVKYVITEITKGRDTLGVIVEMKSDFGNVSINTYWIQKKENSSINKNLNTQQNGSKSSSTIVGSSKCTGSESIALHGISASIICGTTPRGEIVSCARAEIKLGN